MTRYPKFSELYGINPEDILLFSRQQIEDIKRVAPVSYELMIDELTEMKRIAADKVFDKVTWNIGYIRGYREARYPVPAHRLVVDYLPDEVCIWRGATVGRGYTYYKLVKSWDLGEEHPFTEND